MGLSYRLGEGIYVWPEQSPPLSLLSFYRANILCVLQHCNRKSELEMDLIFLYLDPLIFDYAYDGVRGSLESKLCLESPKSALCPIIRDSDLWHRQSIYRQSLSIGIVTWSVYISGLVGWQPQADESLTKGPLASGFSFYSEQYATIKTSTSLWRSIPSIWKTRSDMSYRIPYFPSPRRSFQPFRSL